MSRTQAPPQALEEPRKRSWPRRHKVWTALAAIAALVIVIVIAVSAGGGGSNSTAPSAPSKPSTGTSQPTQPKQTPPQQAAAGRIGTPVRDGKFEFTVTGVSTAKTVGQDPVAETAQGTYTILDVTVRNIGNEPQSLSDTSQYVTDANGRKFGAASTADMAMGPSNQVLLNDINPGNSVQGKIAFDMPAGVTATQAILHDSPYSNGAVIALK